MANSLLRKGTLDLKKQKMLNSFSSMNIGVFIELERIKKPSSIALQTARLTCLFLNAFRDKPQEEDLDSWPKLQQYIHSHVTKFATEILCNIKTKVLIELN